MPAPYFQPGWQPFTYANDDYSLAHLEEFSFQVVDSAKVSRLAVVTFSDHCFTEQATSAHADLVYPGSGRDFSFDRHACSLDLPDLIREVSTREVWNVEGDKFVFLPLIRRSEVEAVYRIIFSVRRVKNLPVKLRIHVETAYPAEPQNPRPLATYGSIRFPHLVRITMGNTKVRKNYDRHRARPRVV